MLSRGGEAATYLDKAFSVFGRTKDLTGQLLTFAKGGAPIKKTRELVPILRDTAQFALSGSSVLCEFSFDTALWPCSIDENQISQVIDNLVINARDAMPRGGTIRVTATNLQAGAPKPVTLSPGRYVCIEVRDEGTGIPPDHLEHIFDPFFTTKQKGSGLGLAVSFSILQRHNGTIEAKSVEGKGTTFTLYIPASASASEEKGQQERLVHHGGGRAIVMDDEEYIRDIAAKMLGSMGYTVTTAASGEEVLTLMDTFSKKGEAVRFLLLDLTVPGGKGGLEVVETLRKNNHDVLCIASSGYSGDPVIAKPQEYGFNGSIKKPYYRSMLASALNGMLT